MGQWVLSDYFWQVRGEKEKHKVEMELIYKYSPFKCYREVMHQFDMITGTSGTLICVYNLRVLDDMDLELDFSTDPKDIRIAGVEPKE